MHPVLFKIPVPDFLEGIFGEFFTVHAYGFFIVLGAVVGLTYVASESKKDFKLPFDKVNTLFLLLLFAAVVGGKVFLYFEDPERYAGNLKGLFSGKGFVFYGSLLFCIPTMLWFFKKNKLPVLQMLDIMAVTTCLVHMFGRMGCFMAGCCHGIEWHGPLAVTFTDPVCLAKPLNTPLHPTQLYSAALIFSIMIALLFIKKRKQFHGQLFLSYLILYAIGRSVIEIFRGDMSRGYVIEGYLSHSQFISLLVLLSSVYFY
ncbi:MAG: prolipoprotein diacylglyceryl transferase family protein, partial [Bacteroidota bacterium]